MNDLIQQKIKQRDNTKGGVTVRARLSNDLRKMISAIKNDDLQKIIKIHEKSAKKRFLKKVDPELIKAQKNDIELIKKHILELELLSKRKYDKDSKKNPKEDTTTSHLLEGADDLDNENKSSGVMDGVVLEQNLPDDATKSQLPTIDISQAMLKVQDMQKQIDQGLDVFSKKLDDLHQMSLDIGNELNEQNRLLEQIDKKVEEEVTKLKNLNAKVDNALDKVGGSNKIMCIICIAIIIVVCAAAALIFLISYF